MKTWTYTTDEYACVVTADDAHLVIDLILKTLAKEGWKPFLILPENLIPLPTHHRHCRIWSIL